MPRVSDAVARLELFDTLADILDDDGPESHLPGSHPFICVGDLVKR
jgi:hypothetical protein